jgi:hypothetical protein
MTELWRHCAMVFVSTVIRFLNGSYRQLTSYELRYGPAQAVLEVLFGAVQAIWKRWTFWDTWIAELVGPSEWIDSGILEIEGVSSQTQS